MPPWHNIFCLELNLKSTHQFKNSLIMKTKLKMSFLAAGTALILLTGCVSSKKYKASQADVAKLKGDSAQLQQQVTSLNGNIQDLQNKNTALQSTLDKTN